MKNKFIDRKNFFIVNNGLYIIIITAIVTILILYLIQFEEKSILESAFDYYLNRK